MKIRFSFLSLLLVVVLASCSKNESNDDGSAKISCTIDGTSHVFNFGSMGIRNDAAGNYSVNIIGFQDNVQGDQITLSVGSNEPIGAREYSEAGEGPDGVDVAGIAYMPAGGDMYTSGYFDENSATIVVTAVSASSIQGTFSGVVSMEDDNGDTVRKTVTNGTFNVAIQN